MKTAFIKTKAILPSSIAPFTRLMLAGVLVYLITLLYPGPMKAVAQGIANTPAQTTKPVPNPAQRPNPADNKKATTGSNASTEPPHSPPLMNTAPDAKPRGSVTGQTPPVPHAAPPKPEQKAQPPK